MATDSASFPQGEAHLDAGTDMSGSDLDFATVQMAQAEGAQPVELARGSQVVTIPVQAGQTIELPTGSASGLLAKIGPEGNLAIVIDGRTIILHGYITANDQSQVKLVTNDGGAIDVAELISATDPSLDIQTAAGPAAGAQGTTTPSGGIFVPFAVGTGLGGIDAEGTLDRTALQYRLIDDNNELFSRVLQDGKPTDIEITFDILGGIVNEDDLLADVDDDDDAPELQLVVKDVGNDGKGNDPFDDDTTVDGPRNDKAGADDTDGVPDSDREPLTTQATVKVTFPTGEVPGTLQLSAAELPTDLTSEGGKILYQEVADPDTKVRTINAFVDGKDNDGVFDPATDPTDRLVFEVKVLEDKSDSVFHVDFTLYDNIDNSAPDADGDKSPDLLGADEQVLDLPVKLTAADQDGDALSTVMHLGVQDDIPFFGEAVEIGEGLIAIVPEDASIAHDETKDVDGDADDQTLGDAGSYASDATSKVEAAGFSLPGGSAGAPDTHGVAQTQVIAGFGADQASQEFSTKVPGDPLARNSIFGELEDRANGTDTGENEHPFELFMIKTGGGAGAVPTEDKLGTAADEGNLTIADQQTNATVTWNGGTPPLPVFLHQIDARTIVGYVIPEQLPEPEIEALAPEGAQAVFVLTIDDSGVMTFVQYHQINHMPNLDPASHDESFPILGVDGTPLIHVRISDFDGDHATQPVNFVIQDDGLDARDDADTTETSDGGTTIFASGNVITGASTIDPGAGGDTVGADRPGTIVGLVGFGGSTDVDPVGDFVVNGKYGTLTMNPDGTYNYDLNEALIGTIPSGATEQFTYKLSDADGDSDSATLEIRFAEVTVEASAKVGTETQDYLKEDGNATLSLTATPGAGDTVTEIKVTNVPDGWNISGPFITTSGVAITTGFDPATHSITFVITGAAPGVPVIVDCTIQPQEDSDVDGIGLVVSATAQQGGATATDDTPFDVTVDAVLDNYLTASADPADITESTADQFVNLNFSFSVEGGAAFNPFEDSGLGGVDGDGSEVSLKAVVEIDFVDVVADVPLSFSAAPPAGVTLTETSDDVWEVTALSTADLQTALLLLQAKVPANFNGTIDGDVGVYTYERNTPPTSTEPASGNEPNDGDNLVVRKSEFNLTVNNSAQSFISGEICFAEDTVFDQYDHTLPQTSVAGQIAFASVVTLGIDESLLKVTITGIPAGATLTINGTAITDGVQLTSTQTLDWIAGHNIIVVPPQDSDQDFTLTFNGLTLDGSIPGVSSPISGTVDVLVDAAADDPTSVSIDVVDSSGSGEEFSQNETGTAKITATFGDFSDGSEAHTLTINAPAGFVFTSVADFDGLLIGNFSGLGTGAVIVTVPAGISGVDNLILNVQAPANFVGTPSFTVEAKAVETPADLGCGPDDTDDPANDTATETAFDDATFKLLPLTAKAAFAFVDEDGIPFIGNENVWEAPLVVDWKSLPGTVELSAGDWSALKSIDGSPITAVLSDGGHTLEGYDSDDAPGGVPNGGAAPIIRVEIVTEDLATGEYSYVVTLLQPLFHPDDSTEDILTIPVNVKYTNSLGGAVTEPLTIDVDDDIPVARGVSAQVTIALDESRPEGTDQGGAIPPQGLASTTVAPSTFFAAHDFGVDGPAGTGAVAYALELDGSNVSSGLFALGVAPNPGAEILLNQEPGGDVVGSVGGTEYIRISVDAAGNLTFSQSRNIWHPVRGGNDDSATLHLPVSETLRLVQTVTDRDGDKDDHGVSLQDVFVIQDAGPNANDDQDEMIEGSRFAATGNVLTGSDAAPIGGVAGSNSGSLDGTADQVDSDGLARIFWDGEIVGTVRGTYGTLTVDLDGNYRYALNKDDEDVKELDTGETAFEEFEYLIIDNDGDSDKATLTITVHGSTNFDVAEAREIPAAPSIRAVPVPILPTTGPRERVSGEEWNGDDNNNWVLGSNTPDAGIKLSGNGGDDRLEGFITDDTLNGGAGDDYLDGGVGRDKMNGGAGNDQYIVNSAFDVLIDDGGIDTAFSTTGVSNLSDFGLYGSIERIVLLPGAGNADVSLAFWDGEMYGNDGNNNLKTPFGEANYIDGGGGDDDINGGGGDDTLFGGSGDDIINNGAIFSFPGGIEIGFPSFLSGGDGNDVLLGRGGDDALRGDAGNDKMDGGTGDDIFLDVDAGDLGLVGGQIEGGDGTDVVQLHNLAGFGSANTGNIKNVEVLDVEGGAGTAIALDYATVIAMTDSDHVLEIRGDEADSFDDLGWTKVGIGAGDGRTFTTYQANGASGAATVYVEDTIATV